MLGCPPSGPPRTASLSGTLVTPRHHSHPSTSCDRGPKPGPGKVQCRSTRPGWAAQVGHRWPPLRVPIRVLCQQLQPQQAELCPEIPRRRDAPVPGLCWSHVAEEQPCVGLWELMLEEVTGR